MPSTCVKLQRKKQRRLIQQRNTCPWCGHYLSLAASNIEHIIPRSLGGTMRWENLAVAHIPCNNERGNDMSIEPVRGRQFQFIRTALADYRNGSEADPNGVLLALERWAAELQLTVTVESMLRETP